MPDESATLTLGASLAKQLTPGLVIFLQGNLGCGKTTLSRGLLRGLKFEGKVKSPTYTLVEPYVVSGLKLYHFDLYRFIDPEEWNFSGFREYFGIDSICLVEWPEKAVGLLPQPDIHIHLENVSDARKALLCAHTEAGKRCLEAISRSFY